MSRLRGDPDVVIVFASSQHDPVQVLDGLWTVLPSQTQLIGCSSHSEISSEQALSGSVTAMALQLGDVESAVFELHDIDHASPTASVDAGYALGEQLRAFGPDFVMVLPDGIKLNSTKLVASLKQTLDSRCPIVGGVASDDLSFVRTCQFFNHDVFTDGVVALALRGPLRVTTVAKAGFQPLGKARTCTKVENDNLILELDGQSALELYKDFLGPEITERPDIGIEFPLAVITASGADYMVSDERSQVIRVVRRLDNERGALQCGGDVYEGAKIRMTRASKTDLIEAARLAAAEAMAAIERASFGLLFNCAGRKIILGARYRQEISVAFQELPVQLPRIGFYTFGEIAPVNGEVSYHDETFTMALIEMP